MEIHPSYLLIPLTISSSFGFVFPTANINNALVFDNDIMSIGHMVINSLILSYTYNENSF